MTPQRDESKPSEMLPEDMDLPHKHVCDTCGMIFSPSPEPRIGVEEKKICNQDYWYDTGFEAGEKAGMDKMYEQLKNQGLCHTILSASQT